MFTKQESGDTLYLSKLSASNPTNNKAVMAVDESNGTIYVCKGENGVAKISVYG